MCNFVSWIDKNDQVLFLTRKLIDSPKGQKLLKEVPQDDLVGHGAIRLFFGIEQDEGMDQECIDFSKTSNFPDSIVKAIKQGEMRGMGTPTMLLKATAEKAYREAIAPAWKAYEEAKAVFWDLFAEPANRTPKWR